MIVLPINDGDFHAAEATARKDMGHSGSRRYDYGTLIHRAKARNRCTSDGHNLPSANSPGRRNGQSRRVRENDASQMSM
jgi:hypothetical protein